MRIVIAAYGNGNIIEHSALECKVIGATKIMVLQLYNHDYFALNKMDCIINVVLYLCIIHTILN